MKYHPLHRHSPFRIFAVSALATVLAIVGVLLGKGASACFVASILIVIEVAFSFDNAILNARVLAKMSPFWQTMFLTVGAAIAVFGMRIVFPIVIVVLTADISMGQVIDLALHHPEEYAEKLHAAHPAIAAFGGSFLLLLALDFFSDKEHQVQWLTRVEKSLKRHLRNWRPPLLTLFVILVLSLLPFNHHRGMTLLAGVLGVVVYSLLHGLTEFMSKVEEKRVSKGPKGVQTGMIAFISFLYLEVLDASFSFDGVIGAFVITQDVILIAVGLGIGALWVRSLTVFMVRRGTLAEYVYVEHGAHYAIGMLAVVLLTSLFFEVPEIITGGAGISVIAASIIASRKAKADKLHVKSKAA